MNGMNNWRTILSWEEPSWLDYDEFLIQLSPRQVWEINMGDMKYMYIWTVDKTDPSYITGGVSLGLTADEFLYSVGNKREYVNFSYMLPFMKEHRLRLLGSITPST